MNVSTASTTPAAAIGPVPTDPPGRAAPATSTTAVRAGAADAAAFAAVEQKDANAAASQDAASSTSTRRRKACYYPLAPNDGAAPASGKDYLGSELRGTRAYERLVTLMATPRGTQRPRTDADVRRAEAAVDAMTFRRGSILLAPCHEGHTEADKGVHFNAPAEPPVVGTPAEPRLRRAIAEPGAAPPSNDTASTVRDHDPANVVVCRAPTMWGQFIRTIAPLVGAFTDFATGTTGTYQAIHPRHGAANTGDPCHDADIARDNRAFTGESYQRHLTATTLTTAA